MTLINGNTNLLMNLIGHLHGWSFLGINLMLTLMLPGLLGIMELEDIMIIRALLLVKFLVPGKLVLLITLSGVSGNNKDVLLLWALKMGISLPKPHLKPLHIIWTLRGLTNLVLGKSLLPLMLELRLGSNVDLLLPLLLPHVCGLLTLPLLLLEIKLLRTWLSAGMLECFTCMMIALLSVDSQLSHVDTLVLFSLLNLVLCQICLTMCLGTFLPLDLMVLGVLKILSLIVLVGLRVLMLGMAHISKHLMISPKICFSYFWTALMLDVYQHSGLKLELSVFPNRTHMRGGL